MTETVSGDGWAAGPNGARMWGKFGAAGLFLLAFPGGMTAEDPLVLMQHRAQWTNFGGTWGIPGGARDLYETVEAAAVRETQEECGIDQDHIEIVKSLVTAGPYPAAAGLAGGWTYTTVIARTRTGEVLPTVANNESAELRWVPLSQITDLPLLSPFAAALPEIKQEVQALV